MSIRRADFPFVFKILSLLIILIVVNVRNKVEIDDHMSSKIEIKDVDAKAHYNEGTIHYVKTSMYNNVFLENYDSEK